MLTTPQELTPLKAEDNMEVAGSELNLGDSKLPSDMLSPEKGSVDAGKTNIQANRLKSFSPSSNG